MLDEVDGLVRDEGQVVTYRLISRKLNLPVNLAKRCDVFVASWLYSVGSPLSVHPGCFRTIPCMRSKTRSPRCIASQAGERVAQMGRTLCRLSQEANPLQVRSAGVRGLDN